MFFLCKKFNSINNIEKEQTKEKRKLSKLSQASDVRCNDVGSPMCSVQNAAHIEIMMKSNRKRKSQNVHETNKKQK